MFSVGLILGGLTTALAGWVIGGLATPLPPLAGAITVSTIAVAVVMRDFRVVNFSLPENRRQVPQEVFLKGPLSSALQFGYEMGTGVRTRVSASAPYVALAGLLLLSPNAPAVITLGASFGAGRALMPWLRYFSNDRRAWDQLLQDQSRSLARMTTLMASFCAAWLAWL